MRRLKGQSLFTVGREGACRAVAIKSTKTWDRNERKYESEWNPVQEAKSESWFF